MAVTNIQLMEWLAKGNGIAKNDGGSQCIPYSGCTTEYQVYDKQEADAYIQWLEQKAGVL